MWFQRTVNIRINKSIAGQIVQLTVDQRWNQVRALLIGDRGYGEKTERMKKSVREKKWTEDITPRYIR
jgi:hypothetical protein